MRMKFCGYIAFYLIRCRFVKLHLMQLRSSITDRGPIASSKVKNKILYYLVGALWSRLAKILRCLHKLAFNYIHIFRLRFFRSYADRDRMQYFSALFTDLYVGLFVCLLCYDTVFRDMHSVDFKCIRIVCVHKRQFNHCWISQVLSVRFHLFGQCGSSYLAAGTSQSGQTNTSQRGTFQFNSRNRRGPERPQQNIGGKFSQVLEQCLLVLFSQQ